MAEHFDAIVVGAGPAGSAAAYTMAKAGLSVLQLERGEYPGAKNVQGAILYADAVADLIPDFREEAPLERHIIEQRMWMLDDRSHIASHFRSENFNEEEPNRYTIIRTQFDKWFSSKVREAGALLICETTVTDLMKDEKGRVVGVRTDREGGEITADVVILAEGVNALVASKAGFAPTPNPENFALGVKEMHFLPQDVIEQRFNIGEDEGVVIEAIGTVTQGMLGTGFIYTNKESLAVGLGCMVSDFAHSGITPYDLLENFKQHPSVKPLLAGSEVKEYSAHMIPEGGYKAMPKVFGDGWMIAGDTGQFVNSLHREGSNMALTTGKVAGETVAALKREGKPMTEANLARYRQTLNDSYVIKDLKKYRELPGILHRNKQFVTTYPQLMSKAMESWFRVDGIDKRTKEKSILKSFLSARSFTGLIGDAIKVARAIR
ncbi:MAG: FAD-dependent oxidoreductase [Alphaproteobacteria bacterium]|jgi:electron transfer flavoprotein-quinone oxidoreductase|nr:FAD-dependent oxidoreductase [Alphaproteobacteria bacterium]